MTFYGTKLTFYIMKLSYRRKQFYGMKSYFMKQMVSTLVSFLPSKRCDARGVCGTGDAGCFGIALSCIP